MFSAWCFGILRNNLFLAWRSHRVAVERVVLNALAMTYAPLPPINCAFGDSLRIVFGEDDPPGDDAANIAGAA